MSCNFCRLPRKATTLIVGFFIYIFSSNVNFFRLFALWPDPVMHGNFSNFLMGNCMSKYRGEGLSHELETHENRSEGSVMQCYRNRAFFERWRFWVTRTNCFHYLFIFNCVLGGLMHKLIWPSELFSSLLDKYCWMCRNSDSRYSRPFIAATSVGSAAWLTGSLEMV